MKLEKLPLKDMFLVQRPVFIDERGRFSRLFDDDDFLNAGLNLKAVNINSSTSFDSSSILKERRSKFFNLDSGYPLCSKIVTL